MALIKPFKAVRPAAEKVEKVSTLPYDVFSNQEARDIVAENPESFLKIVRPETVFPVGTDMYGDMVYEKARDMLKADIANDVMRAEDKECYYIYRQIMGTRAQTGVVACYSVDDYLNNVIKKHEFTRHDKEADRTKHIDVCSAQTGLVFLAFQEKYSMKDLLQEITSGQPIYDFTAKDGVRQIVWKVDDDQKIQAITENFAKMDSLYIADGHHRCASSASVCKLNRERNPEYTGKEEFNYILAVAFPQDELVIYPYNRVVKDLNGMTEEEFVEALGNAGFTVEEVSPEFTAEERSKGVYHTKQKGEIAMYMSGKWYKLNADSSIIKTDAVGSLDVSLLQENVLDKLLGISDPRTDKRIEFVGGIRGMKELEKRCSEDMKVAFAMYPTSMDELFRVTDDGKVMPPKSTWFEPKLQSGLFVHMI